MPTPWEIRRKVSEVESAKEDVRRSLDQYYRLVSSTKTWWQGEAGNVFRQEYEEIKTEVNKLTGKMENLKGRMNTLASEVERADEQRRIEEQKRMDDLRRAAMSKK
jgi:WXG100 family type VII secretion target